MLETLMNKVVKTRREVRLTVTTASKKKSLKKFVAYTMLSRRNVGRYIVKIAFMILLLNVIISCMPEEGVAENYEIVNKLEK